MSRTYQRSFRLEQDLESYMRSLPAGTGNSLANQLFMRFFIDPSLQQEVLGMLKDERFKNWQPFMVPAPPLEGQTTIPVSEDVNPEDFVEEPSKVPIDDIMPGL